MACPSCGAPIERDQRFAALVVCAYCKSAIVYDQEVAKIAGKMSAISDPIGPLFVGAKGRLRDGASFSVMGRVRYGYAQGFWDEWYLMFEDQSVAWLSEDERSFTLEFPLKQPLPPTHADQLDLGHTLSLQGEPYTVTEKGVSVCEGGQGQLPFRILSGEEVRFFDLVNPQERHATLELNPDGTVKVFVGASLSGEDFEIQGTPPDTGQQALETQQAGASRKRVRYDATRAAVIRCKHCGASNEDIDLSAERVECGHCQKPLDLPSAAFDCVTCGAQIDCWSPEAKLATCPACGSSQSIQSGELSLLGELQRSERVRRKGFSVPLSLGDQATFDQHRFTVVGYLRTKESDEGGDYITNEYLLYSKSWGYRWLFCYNGHWALQIKHQGTPPINPTALSGLAYKSGFSAMGQSWRLYERGQTRVDWVEGELPWVAQVGDTSQYWEAIAPPKLLVCERSSSEIEWFVFRYLELKELAQAFSKDIDRFDKPRGLFSCQVDTKTPYHVAAAVICFAFAPLSVIAETQTDGSQIFETEITSQQYKDEYLTPSFDLDLPDSVARVVFESPVDNAWVYLDWALVAQDKAAIYESSVNISFYQGYDGEHWSEGSQKATQYLKIPPGQYQLAVLGDAGVGEGIANVEQGQPVFVRVFQDAKNPLYFQFLFSLAFFMAFIHGLFALIRRNARWSHIESDD